MATMFPTQDLHVREMIRLVSPRQLKDALPVSEAANDAVAAKAAAPAPATP